MTNQIDIQRKNKVILLFDGHCNLCAWAVHFVLKRNPRKNVQFAALSSKTARDFLQNQSIDYSKIDSILLVTEKNIHIKSTAALHLCKHLTPIWKLALLGFAMPRITRDYLYDLIAKNRYRWFGKEEHCMLPSPDLETRFIDVPFSESN
ncbi:MAG: thiol-disulfide oxidoreductase DCC family protein [Flavicella sp.]